jgi:hypothetical protein
MLASDRAMMLPSLVRFADLMHSITQRAPHQAADFACMTSSNANSWSRVNGYHRQGLRTVQRSHLLVFSVLGVPDRAGISETCLTSPHRHSVSARQHSLRSCSWPAKAQGAHADHMDNVQNRMSAQAASADPRWADERCACMHEAKCHHDTANPACNKMYIDREKGSQC